MKYKHRLAPKSIQKNCECCGRPIKNAFQTSHYCTHCAVHNSKNKSTITSLRVQNRILTKKLDGVKK